MTFCEKVVKKFLNNLNKTLKNRSSKNQEIVQKIKLRNPLSWCIQMNTLNTLYDITKKKRKTKSKRKPTNNF